MRPLIPARIPTSSQYWPGSEYVDICGLSIYGALLQPWLACVDESGRTVYDDCNRYVPSNSFSKRFNDFYKVRFVGSRSEFMMKRRVQLYGQQEGKAISIAETSAPFRYHQGTTQPLHGDCDEITMKVRSTSAP